MKAYIFPAAKIVIINRKCFEIPNFCPHISIERSRNFVAAALLVLRKYKRSPLK